eukprot:9531869-Lingulodinium_polyedra.AAC.1
MRRGFPSVRGAGPGDPLPEIFPEPDAQRGAPERGDAPPPSPADRGVGGRRFPRGSPPLLRH